MSDRPPRLRPLWRWSFRRAWCIVALPWLVAAVGWSGYVAATLERHIAEEIIREPEVEISTSSFLASILEVEHLVQSLLNISPEDIDGYKFQQAKTAISNMHLLPGVIAASTWDSSRSAMWIYKENQRRWNVVVEPGDPTQPERRLEVPDPLGDIPHDAPAHEARVPSEWRLRGEVYEKAVEQLHRDEASGARKEGNFRAVVWKFVEKLPHLDDYGLIAMAVAREADGGIGGAYAEVLSLKGESLLDDQARAPKSMIARVLEDGRLAPIHNRKLERTSSFFNQRLPESAKDMLYERLPLVALRGTIGHETFWLAGRRGDWLFGQPLFRGFYLRESIVLSLIFRGPAIILGCFLIITLLLALAHWLILRRFANALVNDLQEVRRLDVLRGPYYWPRTGIAELAALREAVQEAAAGLDNRDANLKDPVLLEAVVRAVPVEGEDGAAPTQNVPLAPPAAFVQAMDTVRRQLGDAKRELETLRVMQVSQGADPGAERVLAERLLVGLRNHTAAIAIADTLAAGLAVTESRLYSVKDDFKKLLAEGDAAASALLPAELARAGHPLLFLAVERMNVLWIDNAGEDPRCARLLAERRLPEPLSLVALLVNDGKNVWIGLRPRGASGWRAAEQVFAEAITRQLPAAPAPKEKAAAATAAYPPGSAHALWAQPNLPADPDKPMYREMVDSAAAGMFTLSRAGRFTYLNTAAGQLFGVPVGTLLGQALIDRAAAGEDGEVRSALQRVLDGAALEERDIHFKRPTGGPLLMRLYLAPLQDEGGEPTGITGCVLDVTALREREMVLTRQEAVYRGIVEGAPQLLWSMDAIGCITFVNGVSNQIYGMAPEEIIGRPTTILCDEATAEKDVERMALMMAGRACTGYRTTHRHKNGTAVPLVVVATRQLDAGGNVTGAVGLAIALGNEEGA